MKGHLTGAAAKARLLTECHHCAAPLEFTVTGEPGVTVHTPGARPLVFTPHVDWDRFDGANILDAY